MIAIFKFWQVYSFLINERGRKKTGKKATKPIETKVFVVSKTSTQTETCVTNVWVHSYKPLKTSEHKACNTDLL